MNVDFPTPESPSSRMGTTGASLIGVMASRSVLAVGARVPSALLGSAVAVAAAMAAMVRCLICLCPVVVPGSSQVHVGNR